MCGAWSHCDNEGLGESTHQLMFHGFESFMVIKSPGLGSHSPYCSTRTSQASLHRRGSPKTNGEIKTQYLREVKEICTLTKRKQERKKRDKRIKTEDKKAERIKPINKPLNENEY